MSRSLLFRALSPGLLDAGASVASSVAAEVPAGINGLLKLATTWDPDAAAAEVERSREALTYQPRTAGGQNLLEGTGRVMGAVSDKVANTDVGKRVNQFIDEGSARHPLSYALASAALGVAAPEARAPAAAERAIVNIGMKVGDKVALTPKMITRALEKRGVKVTSHEVRESGTEPTVIAQLSRPLTSKEAHAVSVELKQDAIAQKSGKTGKLHGPKAAEWGPFNDDFFLSPTERGASTVKHPERMVAPEIYGNPKEIAARARDNVEPEDPSLKRLFGVNRDEMYELSRGRRGNQDPKKFGALNPKGSEAARRVMTPQNEQRLQDILIEGEKIAPNMTRPMDAWYYMDPAYQRIEELVGKEKAAALYDRFNSFSGMASPGTPVPHEIRRGTAARWLADQGRFEDFVNYGGGGQAGAPADMAAVPGHIYHKTAQLPMMRRYMETGQVSSNDPKVMHYVQASGVPQTGFQTSYPVGDTHFATGLGLLDARSAPKSFSGSVSAPEMAMIAPWYRDSVAAKVGLESVPAQARQWGLLARETGVRSKVGVPKLEELSKAIMQTAKRLNISPEEARDLVLLGKAHAGFANPKLLAALGGGGLLALGASKLKKEGKKKVDEINSNNSKRDRNLLEMEQ